MRIAGVQSISLLDYPGTPCAIVFTQGCPFRCAFCHNPELLPIVGAAGVLEDEVVANLTAHKNVVDAVTITGGEPTIQPDLPRFMDRLKNTGFKVKLDTNGVTPTMIKDVITAGLVDYLAMDLKQRWEKYDEVVRLAHPALVERCRETFALIQASGVPHEFRTTILPASHNADDFMAIAGYLRPGETLFIQETRFERTLIPLERAKKFSTERLLEQLRIAYPHLQIDQR